MTISINRSWATYSIIAASLASLMGVQVVQKNQSSKRQQNKKPQH